MGFNELSLLISLFAACCSFAAIFVALMIARSQKRIALLEIRLRILDDMDSFINKVLPNFEWNGNRYPYNQHTTEQVRILFNDEMAEFFAEINKVADKCDMLRGDEERATQKGNYRMKYDYEIEQDRIQLQEDLSNRFKKLKDKAYKKWIKV